VDEVVEVGPQALPELQGPAAEVFGLGPERHPPDEEPGVGGPLGAADVGPGQGVARQAEVEDHGEVQPQVVPGGRVVAGPVGGVPLGAGEPGPAEDEGPLVGPEGFEALAGRLDHEVAVEVVEAVEGCLEAQGPEVGLNHGGRPLAVVPGRGVPAEPKHRRRGEGHDGPAPRRQLEGHRGSVLGPRGDGPGGRPVGPAPEEVPRGHQPTLVGVSGPGRGPGQAPLAKRFIGPG